MKDKVLRQYDVEASVEVVTYSTANIRLSAYGKYDAVQKARKQVESGTYDGSSVWTYPSIPAITRVTDVRISEKTNAC